ncbi:SDR family oxidoreductase [Gellertiella hungarica]|uniref:3-oxoacyl-[acyl-carrier protein] reductase n=1 Tax=Gellertiella hungarica TaxID=1572859 RepID=A0A7W6NLQ6_9HYPH|nr:SDR family oxidoreductase [Gellertiella hungarica]MBB4065680.1 3-oxoacyl-[acyl-carrier protein] reductase [Gellertiella hungarica]
MDLGLMGKRALVLASSRGLGAGIAAALVQEGADVILCGRNRDELAQRTSRLNDAGPGRAFFTEADLFQEDVVERLTTTVSQIYGGALDILVNNSGGPPPGRAADLTPDLLTTYFNAMVLRLIDLTHAVLPGMRERGFGRILTVASSGIIEPIPGLALSNTLRPALSGWSKTLASEVAAEGVTVNMLLPGSILTARLDDLDRRAAERSGRSLEAVRAESEAAIPAGRYGTTEEFGATAAFLLSERASYITGSMIRCDGGAARSV